MAMLLACLRRKVTSQETWSMIRKFYFSHRGIHNSVILGKEHDRRYMIETAPKKDEGVSGATTTEIDTFGYGYRRLQFIVAACFILIFNSLK